MQQTGKGGANRLVALSSGGVEAIPHWWTAEPTANITAVDKITQFEWLWQDIYYGMQRMEQIITQAYGIQYAIFRIRSFNNISTGKIKTLRSNQIRPNAQNFSQYKDTAKRMPGLTSQVSYEDVAAIPLNALEDDSPFLGNTTGVYAAKDVGVGEPLLPARVGKQELR